MEEPIWKRELQVTYQCFYEGEVAHERSTPRPLADVFHSINHGFEFKGLQAFRIVSAGEGEIICEQLPGPTSCTMIVVKTDEGPKRVRSEKDLWIIQGDPYLIRPLLELLFAWSLVDATVEFDLPLMVEDLQEPSQTPMLALRDTGLTGMKTPASLLLLQHYGYDAESIKDLNDLGLWYQIVEVHDLWMEECDPETEPFLETAIELLGSSSAA